MTRIYGGPSAGDLESMQHGAVDSTGRVINVGYTQPFETRALVVAWNADGTFGFRRERGGGTAANDGPVAGGVAVGAAQEIYIAGLTSSAFDAEPFGGGGYDGFLVKYDASGTWQWSRVFGGTGAENPWPEPAGLTAAADGVVVTGFTTEGFDGAPYAGGARDMYIAKYDANGTWRWTELYGGPGSDYAVRNGAADARGFVYVAGATDGTLDGEPNGGDLDVFVTRWNANR
jgi:hypothetical protein